MEVKTVFLCDATIRLELQKVDKGDGTRKVGRHTMRVSQCVLTLHTLLTTN